MASIRIAKSSLLYLCAVVAFTSAASQSHPLSSEPSESRIDTLELSLYPYQLPREKIDLCTIRGVDGFFIVISAEANHQDSSLISVTTDLGEQTLIRFPIKSTWPTPITIAYKRILRTVTVSVTDQQTVVERLKGSNYKFVATHYQVSDNPVICLVSLSYNGYVLMTNECSKVTQRATKYELAQIFNGEIASLSFPLDCDASVVKPPSYGTVAVVPPRVIYKNNVTNDADFDTIKLWALCDNESAEMITFNIEIKRIEIAVTIGKVLMTDSESSTLHIADNHFAIETNLDGLLNENLLYVIPPEISTYFRLKYDGEILLPGQYFTQADIESSSVTVGITHPINKFEAYMNLTLVLEGIVYQQLQFQVSYRPQYQITNTGFYVMEGESVVLSPVNLKVSYGVFEEFDYEIISGPNYGDVSILGGDNFTLDDLQNDIIVYYHDGSESTNDSFKVRATSYKYPIEYQLEVDINVLLTNDNSPRSHTENKLYVIRGLDTVLSSNNISYVDEDLQNTPGTLKFERQGIRCGDLINVTSGAAIYVFSQEDINNEMILFRHYSDHESCRMVLWLSDGEFMITAMYQVFSVQHILTSGGTHSLHIGTEGHAALSKRTLELSTNTRVAPNNITLVINHYPKSGLILTKGEYTPSFSYQNILNLELEYQHSGSIAARDWFSLDIILTENFVATIGINITISVPEDMQTPNISGSKLLIGQPYNLRPVTKDHLSVSHALLLDNRDTVFHMKKPSSGTPEFSGYFIFRNSSREIVVSRFTQQDVNDGLVIYRLGSHSENFTLIINIHGVVTDTIFQTVVMPLPLDYEIESLVVPENGEVIIPASAFSFHGNIVLPTSFYSELVMETTILPQHGTITNFDVLGWDDLADSKLVYKNSGTEQITDAIGFELSHPQFEIINQTRILRINILPQNDNPPEFAIGQPLVIWNDEAVPVTREHILLQDLDIANSTLSEQLLIYVEEGDGDFVVSGAKHSSFVQGDVNNGVVTYHPSKNKNGESFNEVILFGSDGIHNVTTRLQVLRERRQLSKMQLSPVRAIPYIQTQLSSHDLSTLSNDPRAHILYQVVSQPRYGMIYMNDRPVSSFAQQEIESGKVYYYSTQESDTAQLCFNISSQLQDQLHYLVSDEKQSVTLRGKMKVVLSFMNVQRAIAVNPLVVIEGTAGLIDEAVFDTKRLQDSLDKCRTGSIEYELTVVRAPQHGSIRRTEIPSTLEYTHDHSESRFDNLTIAILYKQSGMQPKMTTAVEFDILISSINDHPPQLLAKPIAVFAGLLFNLTKSDIYITDPDTGSKNILINVFSETTEVTFHYLESFTRVTAFTQEDLEMNHIGLVVEPTWEHDRLMIDIQITDGEFTVDDKLQLTVQQLSMTPLKLGKIPLIQGTSESVLHGGVLTIESEPAGMPVSFRLSKNPLGGFLSRSDSNTALTVFSQIDVIRHYIVFRQTELLSSDLFTLAVLVAGVYVGELEMQVLVKPNIVTRDSMMISTMDPVVISTDALDATPLTQLAVPENIVYEINQPPKYGRIILKTSRERRAAVDISIDEFTHADVMEETIFYVPQNQNFVTPEEIDAFTYTVSCPGVAPATGVFTIAFSENAIPQPTLSELEDEHLEESIDTKLLAALIVISLIICSVAFSIIVVCLRLSQRRRHHKQQMPSEPEPRMILTKENGSYKLLVAGDEDFVLMPHSPERCIDPNGRPEYSSTIPSVRVTPMLEIGHPHELESVPEEELESMLECFTEDTNTTYRCGSAVMHAQSFESLPQIRKPNYSF